MHIPLFFCIVLSLVCCVSFDHYSTSGIRARMSDFQLVGGVKKLNHQNYNTWATCISSYLQGQDLWEVVNGSETTQPEEDAQGALRKWKIKAGKAMFVLKTTVEEEILEHIRDSSNPKEAWDVLAVLFSKKNDTKLQLLENELMSVDQQNVTITQFFHKVKTLCREIRELDPQANIGEPRMKRIIIHGLKAEFRSFVAAIQGWPTQPSLAEFENLLASQEALAKQMGGLTTHSEVKKEAEALYAERTKSKYRQGRNSGGSNRHQEKIRSHEHSERKPGESDKGEPSGEWKSFKSGKRFPFKCYNCGRRGHVAKNCRSTRNEESNVATAREEEGWDAEAHVAQT
ncbi:hypothetical protein L1987_16506 [Smallanthus sonchifolius]|uniref:Uncharacterized protein n=1 Tax=Smallanthus sonchifolius TaxID=185202 RepID=A0ACB9J9I1_9ASTR|nr:hypothetical protein L1987_16506 [Smallanthus sonchifolius]